MRVPEPSRISTVEFASAVPVIVGVVSLVRYGAIVSVATLEMTGTDGARESMVKVVAVGVLVFPTVSVRVTLYVVDPSGRGDDGVNE